MTGLNNATNLFVDSVSVGEAVVSECISFQGLAREIVCAVDLYALLLNPKPAKRVLLC